MALSTLYEDMSCTIPLVFVLSSGSDPMSSFLRFAKEKGYTERCVREVKNELVLCVHALVPCVHELVPCVHELVPCVHALVSCYA